MVQSSSNRPISESLKEYARGITGGLLFSFPMLFTMEVWWAGFIAKPESLLLVLITYLLLLGYNRYAGMHPDVTWRSVLVDSIEELGIGLLISFGVLLMLKRIVLNDMAIDEIMGKVIIEAMAVSVGVSVGTSQLGAEKDNTADENQDKSNGVNRDTKTAMFVLGLCGAILIGGNVAPTEEIVQLAVESGPIEILVMALVSLLLCIVVVFFSDFRGTINTKNNGLLYNIAFDTCLSYLTALGAGAFMLWFFGRFEGVSFWIAFSQVIVLGIITSLGASAGRLLIK